MPSNQQFNGWVHLHRKMLTWEWYDDTNAFRAFVHCLLLANWKDSQWRGKTIPRGSFFTSYGKFGDVIGLSVQQARTAFDKLKSTGELTIKSTGSGLLVTVCKYDDYNDPGNPNQQPIQQAGNSEITGEQQGDNRQVTTAEEGEEGKKDKKEKKSTPQPSRAGSRDRRPTVSELIDAIPSDLRSELRAIAERFALARQSYVPAAKRFGTVQAFVIQCNRMKLYPVHVVEDAVDAAIAGEWKSWEQESTKHRMTKQPEQQEAFAENSF